MQGLLGVGGDHDGVEGLGPGGRGDPDAVLAADDAGHGAGEPDVRQGGGQFIDVAARAAGDGPPLGRALDAEQAVVAEEGEEVPGRVGQCGGRIAGPDGAHHRRHEVGDEVVTELLPGEELAEGYVRFSRRTGLRPRGFRCRDQRAGPAVEPHDFQQHPQVAAAPECGEPGNDAAGTGPGAGVFEAAAVTADGHAHFRILGFDAQFGEDPQQRRVGPLVVDNEAGVHGQGRAVALGHVVGVGMAAQTGVRFEEGHPVPPVQHVRCGQPRDTTADDGYPPTLWNPCCL